MRSYHYIGFLFYVLGVLVRFPDEFSRDSLEGSHPLFDLVTHYGNRLDRPQLRFSNRYFGVTIDHLAFVDPGGVRTMLFVTF